jgi:hypothetical protein
MPLFLYPLYAQEATATGDITTTAATPALATGMSITPGAGTYLVWFSASVEHDTNTGNVQLSIYANGALVANSAREVFNRTKGDRRAGATQCKVTVGDGQAIEGRWSTPGGTATMGDRTLTLQEVNA